ncbi:P2Y purinoceptor 13-like [Sphaeramia orbicularis]|uniref:P2Y purinoceptor 13-like n=1 Tax=Sphaeramia orbicularis TaxID=375764 RepID=UPI00117DD9F1|nr:P2Y purinoceptor 13-like [Sphaeramia orbicularis]
MPDAMMKSFNTSQLSAGCPQVNFMTVENVMSYFFFLLFPVALILNGVAAWVSLHLRSTSTFIVYLKNLVASDLLMTLTLPVNAASMQSGATVELRAFACRYSNVIFYCCMYASIALMGLISLDRFFKIVKPCGKMLGQSVMFSLVMSVLVWVTLIGGTVLPTITLTDQDPVNTTDNFCMSLKSKSGLILHKFVVLSMEILFWFVCLLVVFCYICITMKVLQSFKNSGSNNNQGKKKTKLRVFLILLVFFVCFVPFHLMRIPFTLQEILGINICPQLWIVVVHHVVLWVSTTNACLDPFLYIFLCREYRDKLVDMMKARGICIGLYTDEREETSQ